MTREDIRQAVLRALGEIAPETDASQLDPQVPLREQLDLDSMDVLNFLIALHTDLGVEIPERDAPQLATLDGAVDYLAERLLQDRASGDHDHAR